MLRAFGHPVAIGCDMLGVVGSNLKLVKFFMHVVVWPGSILVPRDRAPFGQHQESRPLAGSDFLNILQRIRFVLTANQICQTVFFSFYIQDVGKKNTKHLETWL